MGPYWSRKCCISPQFPCGRTQAMTSMVAAVTFLGEIFCWFIVADWEGKSVYFYIWSRLNKPDELKMSNSLPLLPSILSNNWSQLQFNYPAFTEILIRMVCNGCELSLDQFEIHLVSEFSQWTLEKTIIYSQEFSPGMKCLCMHTRDIWAACLQNNWFKH